MATMAGNTVDVVHAMDGMDEDGDGGLNATELKILDPNFLKLIGMPDTSAAEMFRQFDKNNDRQLDLGERQLVVGRVVPQLTAAVEEVARTQDFEAARDLNKDLNDLKKSMKVNFKAYLAQKEATERKGLYNFGQYSQQTLDAGFVKVMRECEEHFDERLEALERQFDMKAEVLAWDLMGARKPGTALVPKPTTHTLEMRASLHHLSNQKRFDEAIELQKSIDAIEQGQLSAFEREQVVFSEKRRAALTEEFAAAVDRLDRRRRAELAKIQDKNKKNNMRLSYQGAIYKRRLEHCHTKSSQHVAVVGSRPVRVPAVPTLPNLEHAAQLGGEGERTRGGAGSDGKYQLTLPRVERNSDLRRRPMHQPGTYLVDPMWTRKGLAATTTPMAMNA